MRKLKDDGIGSGCHLGGTDKGDAHGSRADTAEDNSRVQPEWMMDQFHINQQGDQGKNASDAADR